MARKPKSGYKKHPSPAPTTVPSGSDGEPRCNRDEARSKLFYCRDTRGVPYDDYSYTLEDVLCGFGRVEIDIDATLNLVRQFDKSTGKPSDDQIAAKLFETEAFLNWWTESCEGGTEMRPADAPDYVEIGHDETGREYYNNLKYDPGAATENVWALMRDIGNRCGWPIPERPRPKEMMTAFDELAALDRARNWLSEKIQTIRLPIAPSEKHSWLKIGVPPVPWHNTPLCGLLKEIVQWAGTTDKTLHSKNGKRWWVTEWTGKDTPYAIYFPTPQQYGDAVKRRDNPKQPQPPGENRRKSEKNGAVAGKRRAK